LPAHRPRPGKLPTTTVTDERSNKQPLSWIRLLKPLVLKKPKH